MVRVGKQWRARGLGGRGLGLRGAGYGAEGGGEGFGELVDVGAGERERRADFEGAAVRAGRADQDAALAQAVDHADRGVTVGFTGIGVDEVGGDVEAGPRTAPMRGVPEAMSVSVSRR